MRAVAHFVVAALLLSLTFAAGKETHSADAVVGENMNLLEAESGVTTCPRRIHAAVVEDVEDSRKCRGHATVTVRGKGVGNFCARVFEPEAHSESEKLFTFNGFIPPVLDGGLYVQFPHEITSKQATVEVSVDSEGQSNTANVFFWYSNDTKFWNDVQCGLGLGKTYIDRCHQEMPKTLSKAGFKLDGLGPWYDVDSTQWRPDHGSHQEMWTRQLNTKHHRASLMFGRVKTPKGPTTCCQTAGMVVKGPCSLSITSEDATLTERVVGFMQRGKGRQLMGSSGGVCMASCNE